MNHFGEGGFQFRVAVADFYSPDGYIFAELLEWYYQYNFVHWHTLHPKEVAA